MFFLYKNISSWKIQMMSIEFLYRKFKLVFSDHSKMDNTKVLKTGGRLVQVKSIAECSTGVFCNTFDKH